MLATPDSFRPNQSPLGAIHLPQAPTIVRHNPLPEGFSEVAGEVDLSSALADSRSISFVLTDPAPILWAKLLCFRAANAIATWRQAKVCLRPLSFFGKDRASRPPPLQHRVPHTSLPRAACADILACVGLSGSLRDLFRPGQVDLRARTLSNHLVSASRLLDIRMSHSRLLTTGRGRRLSAAASLGLFATPDSFRLNQSPLGAYHLPQAPDIRRAHSVTEGPFDSSGGVGLSSALADSRFHPVHPHGIPSSDVGLVALL